MPVFDHRFTVRAPLAAMAAFHHDTRMLRRLRPPPMFVQLTASTRWPRGGVNHVVGGTGALA